MADFRLGFAVGAGLPTPAEVALYAGARAQGLRGGHPWSALDTDLSGTLDSALHLAQLDAYIEDLCHRNIDVILQVGGGSGQGSMNKYSVQRSLTGVASVASTGTFAKAAHGLYVGQPVRPLSGVADNFLTVGTTYYVIAAGFDAGHFRLSATQGGAAVVGSGNDSTLALLGLSPYALAVIAVANRYKRGSIGPGGGRMEVDVIEVGNECNLIPWDIQNYDVADGGIGATAAAAFYAQLMEIVYPGIAAIGDIFHRPWVMIGGIAGQVSTSQSGIGMADWTTGLYAQWNLDGYNAATNPYPYDVWCTHRYCWPYTPTYALAHAKSRQRGWPIATTGIPAHDGGPPLPGTGSQQIREANGDGVKLHAGTEFGTPVAPFTTTNKRGAWAPATHYAVNDVVTDNVTEEGINQTYVCILAHTSSAAGAAGNEPDVGATTDTYWQNGGTDEDGWVAIMDSAITEYFSEPGACWLMYFCGLDNPSGDNGKNFGVWTTEP